MEPQVQLGCDSVSPNVKAAHVSVIIPSYNASRTLPATIASALAQTGSDLEVTVVDDGSTDDSLWIARTFEPSIRVLTGPNRGVSAARNRGLAASKGEWIVFLDADDLLLPGTLKLRLDTAWKSGADVVICDWQELLEQDDETVEGAKKTADMAALQSDAQIACATHV